MARGTIDGKRRYSCSGPLVWFLALISGKLEILELDAHRESITLLCGRDNLQDLIFTKELNLV